jgi:DNA-binding transcriptional LysR family regulator
MQWSERIGRRLKLRDLHILLAVAKSGSMGKAAVELAMSQPAVTKAIADLEHALGVRLLDRSPQGIKPTLYGHALLDCGVAVFDDLRQGVRRIEFLADPTAGELSIGCIEPLAAGFVSTALDHFSQQYPKATFRVVTGDPATLQSRELRQRNVELTLMPTAITGLALEQDTDVEPLFDDRHIVLAAANSKWTRRRNIKLADLMDEPWVLPPPDTPIGSYIAEAFHAAGLDPPPAHILTFSIPLHLSLVAAGRFLTALPISMFHQTGYLPLKVLPVKFPAPPRPMGIVTLKNRTLSPLARLFIDCARAVAKPLERASGRR